MEIITPLAFRPRDRGTTPTPSSYEDDDTADLVTPNPSITKRRRRFTGVGQNTVTKKLSFDSSADSQFLTPHKKLLKVNADHQDSDHELTTPKPPITKTTRRRFTDSVTKKLTFDNSGGQDSDHDLTIPKPKFTTTRRVRGIPCHQTRKLTFDDDNDDGFDHRDLDLLTPAQKLLRVIDKVYEMYMEELDKSRRTPAAMKAERDKRVKTLMSMR